MALYLGLDLSTQALKAVAIDASSGAIAAEMLVHFGNDLPQYHSPQGFLPNEDPLVKRSDPRMWLDALDLVLARLQESGCPMHEIAAISGSAQQHGSVYLKSDIPVLQPGVSLSQQFQNLFSCRTSPIWLDRSTSVECGELDSEFGDRLQFDTGSPAIERFTGPQIRRFFKNSPGEFADTRRIFLVSSFCCSVLCGKTAPVDYGDAAGMNLLNLHTLQWDRQIVSFIAPGLIGKLPRPVPSNTLAGGLDPYFERYGLRAGIPVVVWSGANPSSLIGIGAFEPGIAGIGLGTSDTFFAPLRKYVVDPEGCSHIFGNPAGGFMSLTCFSNGSFAREIVKNRLGCDWTRFGKTALEETQPGNGGRLVLPYFGPECTPLVLTPGVRANYDIASASDAQNIRALLESQLLSMRRHTAWLNEPFRMIRLTGGASQATGLRQIVADIFQSRVEVVSMPNSAVLGAAMRAANVVGNIPLSELASAFSKPLETIEPNKANAPIYEEMLRNYAAMEAK